nr:uncharacterized protein c26f1.08c [Quercus suber]
MGISTFFARHDLLVLGHAIVLIVFLGGGLGLIAWVKQRLGQPLVNVSCSLAALGCILILLKEGAVQAGSFSHERIVQVLMMVLMGIVVTTMVNLVVLPVTARGGLTKDFETTTDLLGELLISITRAFLSGRKYDLEDDYFKKLAKEHRSSLASMTKNLAEAKREYFMIGKEQQYALIEKVAERLKGLSQDLGGLRSAAFAQFAFMDEQLPEVARAAESTPSVSRSQMSAQFRLRHVTTTALNSISETPEHQAHGAEHGASSEESIDGSTPTLVGSDGNVESSQTPSDMFLAFLNELGPPSKSLVYTMKQILDELPFKECPREATWLSWLVSLSTEEATFIRLPNISQNSPSHEIAINQLFVSSLEQAIDLYSESRRRALDTLYQNRALNLVGSGSTASRSTKNKTGRQDGGDERVGQQSDEVLADIEEVTSVCGHFSFSLLDFAQDVLVYLNLLNDLKEATEKQSYSWNWLLTWRRRSTNRAHIRPYRAGASNIDDEERDLDPRLSLSIKKADDLANGSKERRSRSWLYPLYKAECFLQRDDVIFAIKVGMGAMLYSLPAYLQSTRPFFVTWRGEWGLVSYMAICCMTIGASNTTSINRIIGTFVGACLAVIAWVCSSNHGDANPWLLGFFGWIVSIGCFYLIIAKGNGPLGRFILLTFNLGALYSYSLSVQDDDNDDDEGGIDPAIWDIVLHRFVAVVIGVLWGIIITRFVWPISARKKLKGGLCILWLRIGLIWKRDPLAMFLLGEPTSSYMDIREEASLQSFLTSLQSLKQAASSEFELRGPFPDQAITRILDRTSRMLDAIHSLNVVISKNLRYTAGEAAVLRYTRPERFELSGRISHLYSVLASSIKLEYPLNDVLPSIDHTRDRLLGKLSEFRRSGEGRELATEQDYELLYAYVLVTGQLSQEIKAVSQEIESLFGTLNEDHLKLQ